MKRNVFKSTPNSQTVKSFDHLHGEAIIISSRNLRHFADSFSLKLYTNCESNKSIATTRIYRTPFHMANETRAFQNIA